MEGAEVAYGNARVAGASIPVPSRRARRTRRFTKRVDADVVQAIELHEKGEPGCAVHKNSLLDQLMVSDL